MPCNVTRKLRKTLLSHGLWGQHHGCGCVDNPVRGSPHTQPKKIDVRISLTHVRGAHKRKTFRHRDLLMVPNDDGPDASITISEPAISNNTMVTPELPSTLKCSHIPVVSRDRLKPDPPANKERVLLSLNRAPDTTTSKLNICLLNIRSVGDDTKAGKIRDLVENDLDDLHLAIFTETWLRPDQTSSHQIGDITPPGYVFHHRARQGRKGGGVGILLKSIMKAKVQPTSTFSSFEYMNMVITLSNMNIHLIAIYRPPP